MKNKDIVCIITLSLIVIVIDIGFITFNNKHNSVLEFEDGIIADVSSNTYNINQEEYLEQNQIYVYDMKYSYNGEKFILSFMIENKSNKKIDLRNYTINVLDDKKTLLTTIGGSALGVIEANDKMASIIEVTENISTVYELEFIK